MRVPEVSDEKEDGGDEGTDDERPRRPGRIGGAPVDDRSIPRLSYSANVPASDLREAQAVANALGGLVGPPAEEWQLTIVEPEGAEYWEVTLRGNLAGEPWTLSHKFHGPERVAERVIEYFRRALAAAGAGGAKGLAPAQT